jgi:hypothetical protein
MSAGMSTDSPAGVTIVSSPIERCRMLTESLSLVESEEGHRTHFALNKGSAHNGTFRIINHLLQNKRF